MLAFGSACFTLDDGQTVGIGSAYRCEVKKQKFYHIASLNKYYGENGQELN